MAEALPIMPSSPYISKFLFQDDYLAPGAWTNMPHSPSQQQQGRAIEKRFFTRTKSCCFGVRRRRRKAPRRH